jgi:hypothetical protein
MATDILGKLDNEKPFRVEIPDELLENILLIPAEYSICSTPIIKIERKLSCEQVKEMMAHEESKLNQIFSIDTTIQSGVPTFKESLIRKDFHLLGDLVATYYYSKVRTITNWSSLYQVIETDWSLKDFYPVGQAIHYEVFTKREICIKEG